MNRYLNYPKNYCSIEKYCIRGEILGYKSHHKEISFHRDIPSTHSRLCFHHCRQLHSLEEAKRRFEDEVKREKNDLEEEKTKVMANLEAKVLGIFCIHTHISQWIPHRPTGCRRSSRVRVASLRRPWLARRENYKVV